MSCKFTCSDRGCSDRLASFGSYVNVKKIEHLTNDENDRGSITVDSVELPRSDVFKCLGLAITSNRGLEINHRIDSLWLDWKNITGLPCDRKATNKIKSKVYAWKSDSLHYKIAGMG